MLFNVFQNYFAHSVVVVPVVVVAVAGAEADLSNVKYILKMERLDDIKKQVKVHRSLAFNFPRLSGFEEMMKNDERSCFLFNTYH